MIGKFNSQTGPYWFLPSGFLLCALDDAILDENTVRERIINEWGTSKGTYKSSKLNLERSNSWHLCRMRKENSLWSFAEPPGDKNSQTFERCENARIRSNKDKAANTPAACSLCGSLQSQPCSRRESSNVTCKASRLNLHQDIPGKSETGRKEWGETFWGWERQEGVCFLHKWRNIAQQNINGQGIEALFTTNALLPSGCKCLHSCPRHLGLLRCMRWQVVCREKKQTNTLYSKSDLTRVRPDHTYTCTWLNVSLRKWF